MSGAAGELRGGSRQFYARRELKRIAARWDAKAATWERELADPGCHLNEDNAYERFLRQALVEIEERRDFCAREGVIDAGCGTGLVLARVLPAFAWGRGVDISPEMIRVAEAKRLHGARFVVGDCFELGSLCPPAGAVLSRGVLLSHYGLAQAAALLRSARETLVPGGFVVCDFLNEAGRARSAHAPANKTYFTGVQIRSIARQAGLARVRVLGEPGRRVLLLVGELD